MLILPLVSAVLAEESAAPAPIPLLVDAFIGSSPVRVAGGADAAWQDETAVGARASVEGAVASRVAARVAMELPVAGDVESDLAGEARVLLTPHDFSIDGAVGVRYANVAFEGAETKIEAFVALARDVERSRFVLDCVAARVFHEGLPLEGATVYHGSDSGNGDGLTYEDWTEDQFDLAASWRWHAGEHAAVGAIARGRVVDETSYGATVGPTVGVEAGSWSGVVLVGFADASDAPAGVRSALIVQLAL
jgi:hypothetical protein